MDWSLLLSNFQKYKVRKLFFALHLTAYLTSYQDKAIKAL